MGWIVAQDFITLHLNATEAAYLKNEWVFFTLLALWLTLILTFAGVFFITRPLNRLLKQKSMSIHRMTTEIMELKRFEDKLKISEEKFRALYDTSSDALMTLEPPDWRFTDGNLATIKLFNTQTKENFCATAPWVLSPEFQPDGIPSGVKAPQMIMKAIEEGSHFFEWTHKKLTGEEFFATVLLTRMQLGEKVFLQATVRDITESKKTQEKLRKSEERFRNIVSINIDPILVIDLEGTVQFVNRSAEKIFNRSAKEFIGLNFGVPLLNAEFTEIDIFCLGNESRTGEMFSARTQWENKEAYLIMIRDITEHRKAEKALQDKTNEIAKVNDELEILATHDVLTGLANRRYFDEMILKTIAFSERYQKKFALMLIDVDAFKWINDTFGHDIGDATLKKLADSLRENVRSDDFVARIGGDEFVIILNEIEDLETVLSIAHNISNSYATPITIKGITIFSSVSVGITFYPSLASDVETLLKQADIAMYRSKSKGKGCVEMYSDEIEESYIRINEIIYALQFAIKNHELSLLYQPIIDLHTKKIVGVEALLRWENQKLGNVPPDNFIPIAERIGAIHEIGLWVFNEVCKQAQIWQQMGLKHLFLAINISPVEFTRDEFTNDLQSIVNGYAIDPRLIEIELTETSVTEENEVISQKIVDFFKHSHFQLSIDDFGTGYSSMTRLSKLPVHTLKIDRSFVNNLTKEDKRYKIVHSTITLAKGMSIKTIAEGVETIDEERLLLELGCQMAQGYYYYVPMMAKDIEVLLIREKN